MELEGLGKFKNRFLNFLRKILSMIWRLSYKLVTFPGHLKRFKDGTISAKMKTQNCPNFEKRSIEDKKKLPEPNSFTKKLIAKWFYFEKVLKIIGRRVFSRIKNG